MPQSRLQLLQGPHKPHPPSLGSETRLSSIQRPWKHTPPSPQLRRHSVPGAGGLLPWVHALELLGRHHRYWHSFCTKIEGKLYLLVTNLWMYVSCTAYILSYMIAYKGYRLCVWRSKINESIATSPAFQCSEWIHFHTAVGTVQWACTPFQEGVDLQLWCCYHHSLVRPHPQCWDDSQDRNCHVT